MQQSSLVCEPNIFMFCPWGYLFKDEISCSLKYEPNLGHFQDRTLYTGTSFRSASTGKIG